MERLVSLGICGALLASCDAGSSRPTITTQSCAAAHEGAMAELGRWMAEPGIERWGEWAARTGFQPTDAQRQTLAEGGVLVGIAALPIRHGNGMLEVVDEVFAEIEDGLDFDTDFERWHELALFDPRDTAQVIAATRAAFARNHAPVECADDLPVTSVVFAVTDGGMPQQDAMVPPMADAGTPMADAMAPPMADAGTPMADAGMLPDAMADAAPPDAPPPDAPPPINCKVQCDVTLTKQLATAADNTDNADGCDETWVGETQGSTLTDEHKIRVWADSGKASCNYEDVGWSANPLICGCTRDSGATASGQLKISMTGTCRTLPADPAKVKNCPTDLKWKLEGEGAAKHSAEALAMRAFNEVSNSCWFSCNESNSHVYAEGGARCGATGAEMGSLGVKAEAVTTCTGMTETSGQVEWSQKDGWKASIGGKSALSCAIGRNIQAHSLADCIVDPGPTQVMHTEAGPGVTEVWAQVGGRTFKAYALGQHDDLDGAGGTDGTHGKAEAKILGGGYARVASRCSAWSTMTGMIGCSISTIDPPPPPMKSWAAYSW